MAASLWSRAWAALTTTTAGRVCGAVTAAAAVHTGFTMTNVSARRTFLSTNDVHNDKDMLPVSDDWAGLLLSHGLCAPAVSWSRAALSKALAARDLVSVEALLPTVAPNMRGRFWAGLIDEACSVPDQDLRVVMALVDAATKHFDDDDFLVPCFKKLLQRCAVADTACHRAVLFHHKVWADKRFDAPYILRAYGRKNFFDGVLDRAVRGDKVAIAQLTTMRELLSHVIAPNIRPKHIKRAVSCPDINGYLAAMLATLVTSKDGPNLDTWDTHGTCMVAFKIALQKQHLFSTEQLMALSRLAQGRDDRLTLFQVAVQHLNIPFLQALVADTKPQDQARVHRNICVLLNQFLDTITKQGAVVSRDHLRMMFALMIEAGVEKPASMLTTVWRSTLRGAEKMVSSVHVLDSDVKWEHFWAKVAAGTVLVKDMVRYPLAKALWDCKLDHVDRILHLTPASSTLKSWALFSALDFALWNGHKVLSLPLVTLLVKHGLDPLDALKCILGRSTALQPDIIRYLSHQVRERHKDLSVNNNELLWLAYDSGHTADCLFALVIELLEQPEVARSLKQAAQRVLKNASTS